MTNETKAKSGLIETAENSLDLLREAFLRAEFKRATEQYDTDPVFRETVQSMRNDLIGRHAAAASAGQA